MTSSVKTRLLLAGVFLLLFGCAQKTPLLYVPSDINTKIAEANQSVCSYKGRITVLYSSPEEDVRFKGYLDKDCADNFRLMILGLFGSVAYDLSYRDGIVEAYEKGEDVSEKMEEFMLSRGLDTMVSLIRYPHVKIDNGFAASSAEDEYLLTKNGFRVYAGADYLINRIEYATSVFSYEYEDGKLAGLAYSDGGIKVEIKLR